MTPWIFFLFVGVFDMGFYSYMAICVENAARAAATQTATASGAVYQSNTMACTAALNELSFIPNVAGLASCGALPVIVTRTTLCDQTKVEDPTNIVCEAPCGRNSGCGADATGKSASSQVAVQFQSDLFVPIPGVLTGQLNLTRVAEMRIIAE
jgi:hypothetical protein